MCWILKPVVYTFHKRSDPRSFVQDLIKNFKLLELQNHDKEHVNIRFRRRYINFLYAIIRTG